MRVEGFMSIFRKVALHKKRPRRPVRFKRVEPQQAVFGAEHETILVTWRIQGHALLQEASCYVLRSVAEGECRCC